MVPQEEEEADDRLKKEQENDYPRCRGIPAADRPLPAYPVDRDPLALFTVCEFDARFSSSNDDDDDVIPMFADSFSVGTSADCDVVLSDYVDPRSPCFRRFSARHLVVFRDKYA